MASAHSADPGATLLPGRPAPALTVAPPSLAMALPTAMLLVDYAARGKTTPGPWPQAAARRLPPALLDEALGLRAILGHGDGLRRFLLLRLPAGHAGHRSWPVLRGYLAGLGPDGFAELIEYGVAGNIVYGERMGHPLGAADREALAAAGQEAADRARELRVAWLLGGWGVADAARTALEVADPARFGRQLLDLLDAIVEAGFEDVWSESLPDLLAAGADVPAAAAGTPPREWVSRVSGLVPDARWESWFERATTVTCIPCPLLGSHLTVFATADPAEWDVVTGAGSGAAGGTSRGETVWVGYEPRTGTSAAVMRPTTAAVDLGRLGSLGAQVGALGDQTRLSILLTLAAGARTAQQLSDELGIHLSTVSRQVGQLEKAGLLTVSRQGAVRHYDVDRGAIRRLCQTIEQALG